MFVCDLRQVGCFLREFRFPPSNKTVSHEITEIFLKVALNTITLTTSTYHIDKGGVHIGNSFYLYLEFSLSDF
jgi:hypothetical protein